ncbi:MAG: DUF3090 family protein, partial [Actinomycetota bacterium]
MTRRILTFDAPRRFISGTVGMPGERTFYLQVARGANSRPCLLRRLRSPYSRIGWTSCSRR